MLLKNNPSNEKQHFTVLAGLRGIAVILVVWFHFWQQSWLSPPNFSIFGWRVNTWFLPAVGFMGVEIFIVLGAFGLYYPFARLVFEGTPVAGWKQYAYRRVIKILPSFFIMLILVMILGRGTVFMQGQTWSNLLSHFLMVHNLFKSTLYRSVNSVAWFVGLQVQFYIVFPFLALAFRKRPILTYLLLQAVGIGYRLFILYYQYDNLGFLFNQLPGYIDMYANGMLAAYLVCLFRNKLRNLHKLKVFFTLASITCVIYYMVLMYYMYVNSWRHSVQDYQMMTRQYFGWTLLILTVSSIYAFRFWKMVLANPLFRFAAVISYNLYLWHQWIAVQFRIRKFIPASTPDPHNDLRWKIVYSLAITATSVLVAIFFTFLVERPLVKKGFRRYFADIVGFPRKLGKFLRKPVKQRAGQEPGDNEKVSK